MEATHLTLNNKLNFSIVINFISKKKTIQITCTLLLKCNRNSRLSNKNKFLIYKFVILFIIIMRRPCSVFYQRDEYSKITKKKKNHRLRRIFLKNPAIPEYLLQEKIFKRFKQFYERLSDILVANYNYKSL